MNTTVYDQEKLMQMSVEEIISLTAEYVKQYLEENNVDKSKIRWCYLTIAGSIKVLKQSGKIP